MLIPRFYNVREFVGSSMDGVGYILLKDTVLAEAATSRSLLTDVQKLLKDIRLAKEGRLTKPTEIYKELLGHKFDLEQVDIFLAFAVEGNRKQILRTIKIYAEGGTLELPKADNCFFDELEESEKRLVLKRNEVQLLNAISLISGELFKVHFYSVTHPDDFDFIYFGTVIKETATLSDIELSVRSYWKDAKRPDYNQNGIKAIFKDKSDDWYARIKYTQLGSIATADKENRYPFLGRLSEIAEQTGYFCCNAKSDRYRKIQIKDIAMQGPIVNILLWGNLTDYIFET